MHIPQNSEIYETRVPKNQKNMMYGIFHNTSRFERGATKENCPKVPMSRGSVKIIAEKVMARVSRIRSILGNIRNHFLRASLKRMIPRVAKKLSWRDISKLRLTGEKNVIIDKEDKSIARLSNFLQEKSTPYPITHMIAALKTDILGHTSRTNRRVKHITPIHWNT
jgi:hypothetical protein